MIYHTWEAIDLVKVNIMLLGGLFGRREDGGDVAGLLLLLKADWHLGSSVCQRDFSQTNSFYVLSGYAGRRRSVHQCQETETSELDWLLHFLFFRLLLWVKSEIKTTTSITTSTTPLSSLILLFKQRERERVRDGCT